VQNDFKGISKEIIAMSKTVPDNAQKLTKALYQIVSAGYDGAEAMKILRTSTELAVASVTDTFTAADTLTYVMNAYGEAAGTAARISDKLFTIVRLGKVKMEELGPTISMVTGLAAEAGLEFNELAAIYAEAVKKIQPHIVSTGIRGIVTAMLRVSKGTGDAADAARELGIEFDIQALKAKGFKQVLNEIIVATKGNEGALMRLFPNVRGLIGLLAIMTNEGENYNKTLHEIENSLGATDKAFKTMVDTTENQLAILRNNVMAKLKPLGDILLKQMNDIASGINIAMSGANDELSKLARSYSELTDTLQRKQGRIDNLIKTVEDLRNKTELTKTETIELEAAERALGVYFPILGKAAEGAAGSIDILTKAKEGSIDLSIRIMELGLEQAKIEMRRADLAKELYDR
ncbi:MAG: phage tail tape measure protein, partial [Candidatus Marinimicrobia bacterium]|nr:phage tail tape measure protein [Candidatus Neomarinimicrobiota bacterium]